MGIYIFLSVLTILLIVNIIHTLRIEKTRDKLIAATKELDNTSVRTRTIGRKLKEVQALPATDSKLILEYREDESDDNIDF
ncbi:MAG: hypothetical protein IPM47_11370 [Sphingobacteriales bacterium]|nr:MAG: hypothetical protein IPM47_11370 [Sphingobacteriales bacterium]